MILKRLMKRYGFSSLLSEIDANPKIIKSNTANEGYLTKIMHLAPANSSGYEVCHGRTKQCTDLCLNTAGCVQYLSSKLRARIARTKFFFEQRSAFKDLLFFEIENHRKFCSNNGLKPALRLNGTSDICWEKVFPDLFTEFHNCQMYDYTKIAKRFDWDIPSNYYLLFSRAETDKNQSEATRLLAMGYSVAVVFGGCGYGRHRKPLPPFYMGYPVFDGDKTDLRFLDPPGYVIGVRAKGKAYQKKPKKGNGFVVTLNVLTE